MNRSTPEPPDAPQDRNGWDLMCEGILRTQFGQQPSSALAHAVTQLAKEEAVARAGETNQGKVAPVLFTWPRLALAAAVALLLAPVGMWLLKPVRQTPPVMAQLTVFSGEVQVVREGRLMAAEPNMPLQSGDEIRTAGASSARIEYAGEATWLELAEETMLEMDDTPQGKRLIMRQGRFKAAVAPQPVGRPMHCRTAQAVALVLGTVFTLDTSSDQTLLTVERGVVRLSQTDGSAEDVKSGEAARAVLGAPVSRVPYLARDPRAYERTPLTWIMAHEPLALPPGGTVSFDFATRPNITLVKGAFWQPPSPSLQGHLVLTGTGPDNYGYKAVTPYVSVASNEAILVTGRAKHLNGALLRLRYYLSDSTPRCFGHLVVKGQAASDSTEFVPFQFEFTLPGDADLGYIALVLYCHHADGSEPQEGDAILIDELRITRGPLTAAQGI
jgi:hypothetical protein